MISRECSGGPSGAVNKSGQTLNRVDPDDPFSCSESARRHAAAAAAGGTRALSALTWQPSEGVRVLFSCCCRGNARVDKIN